MKVSSYFEEVDQLRGPCGHPTDCDTNNGCERFTERRGCHWCSVIERGDKRGPCLRLDSGLRAASCCMPFKKCEMASSLRLPVSFDDGDWFCGKML